MDELNPPSPEVSPGEKPSGPRRRVSLLVLAIALLVIFLIGGFQTFVPTAALQAGSRVVEIPPAIGLYGMARLLRDSEVIRGPLTFVVLTLLRGSARALRAGEYEFPKGASLVTVVRHIEEGRFRPRIITFAEGFTLREAGERLEEEGLATRADVFRLAHDPGFLWRLGIPANSIEGYLFPDTYHLFKGMRVEEILVKMVHRLWEVLTPDLLAQADDLKVSVHELLTLASIIEKEAVLGEERPLISAVFWNRLKRDMPLQADPTVGYAVRKINRALTLDDLRVDSPYNTYRNPGLPPTPISNPGKASIVATLNPAKVNYLYFVSMDGTRHHFSSTWSQHAAAVARYRGGR